MDELDLALSLDLEWVGVPYRHVAKRKFKGWKQYPFSVFEEFAEKHGVKIWILGLHEGGRDLIHRKHVFGFDTVIPVIYSTRYGKVWYSWSRAYKPEKFMRTYEILDVNLKNFKEVLKKEGIEVVKRL